MDGKQLGFSDYELTAAKKQSKREKFFSEMDAVVPWQPLNDYLGPEWPAPSWSGEQAAALAMLLSLADEQASAWRSQHVGQ